MERIANRQHPVVKRFRELARGPGPEGVVLLDGEHLVEEALASGVPLDIVAFGASTSFEAGRRATPRGLPRIQSCDTGSTGLAAKIRSAGIKTIQVTDQVLAAISPVRSPSGIVAIARCAAATLDEPFERAPQLVVVLAAIQDAGNVGAIVRTAEACGATGIVATEETADPFGWKALRGAMGSTFRMPIAVRQPIARVAQHARDHRIRVLATVPHDGTPLPDCDLRRPAVILLGGEGRGLPNEVLDQADEHISIPMRQPVESLNVSVAAALVLYEALTQRERSTARQHEPVR
jgi:RNA methyltransferase, TrmH family